MERDSLGDDYDSVEEDVLSEPSPTEETIASFGDLQLHCGGSQQKEASDHQDTGRCSGLDSGGLTMLEFNKDQSSKSVNYTLVKYHNNNSLRALLLRESLLVNH